MGEKDTVTLFEMTNTVASQIVQRCETKEEWERKADYFIRNLAINNALSMLKAGYMMPSSQTDPDTHDITLKVEAALIHPAYFDNYLGACQAEIVKKVKDSENLNDDEKQKALELIRRACSG